MTKTIGSGIILALTAMSVVASALLETGADLGLGQFQRRDNAHLKAFARSLGLSNIDIRDLSDRYSKAENGPKTIDLACLTAQDALGEGQVNTPPLNQTVVDANW